MPSESVSLRAHVAAQSWVSGVPAWLGSPWACLVSGCLMPLAFAPTYAWWLVFPLLIPLLLASRHPNPDQRIFRGALFGMPYFCLSAYWFVYTLVEELGYPWYGAVGANLLIAGACGLAPTVFCWWYGYFQRLGAVWQPLVIWALWTLIEGIRFQAFGGGPWVSLALSQVDAPLVGFVPVFGEEAASGLTVVVSYFVVQLLWPEVWCAPVRHPARKRLGAVVALLLLLGMGGWFRTVEWALPSGQPLRIAMVQPATAQKDKWQADLQYGRLDQLSALSRPYLGRSDLVIWPETVVNIDRFEILSYLQPLHQQALEQGTTLLMGGYEMSMQGTRYNAAFTLGEEPGQVYHKRHLVPFGEFIPPFLGFLKGVVPGDSFRAKGRIADLMAVKGHLMGNSICWEGAFSRDNTPLVRQGAEVLVNIANEAWFFGTPLPRQNLDAMRLRAIEHGRPAVRVANYGPGALIDHHGRVLAWLPEIRAGSAEGVIQPMRGWTPFAVVGADGYFLLALAVLMSGGMVVRRLHERNS